MEEGSEAARLGREGAYLVVLVKGAGVGLELGRLAGKGDPAIALDPVVLGIRSDLEHRLADDVSGQEAGEALEGRVQLEEAVSLPRGARLGTRMISCRANPLTICSKSRR